jgi:hypothetical protein
VRGYERRPGLEHDFTVVLIAAGMDIDISLA